MHTELREKIIQLLIQKGIVDAKKRKFIISIFGKNSDHNFDLVALIEECIITLKKD